MNLGPGLMRTPLPQGFTASGINCGVRKYRPDLGLIMSDRDCVAGAVFTLNECKAAPVLYSQALLPSKKIRAIVTNSGQANAATGEEGVRRNLMMVEAAAKAVGCDASQVLVASTGIIGHQIDIEKLAPAMPQLVDQAASTAEPFGLAILTTDLVPKTVTTVVQLSQGAVRISGISKGSGMIHPNMATMLGYLLTDCEMPEAVCQSMLKQVTDLSFNMISVDGDMSTNDCVFMLANGASGVGFAGDEDFIKFREALTQVAQALAKAIARDGEGADKLIEVNITGSKDREVAARAARAVTTSPLFKAAMQGCDPNWGRILAKLGAAQVPAKTLDRMEMALQGVKIFAAGSAVVFDREQVRVLLKSDIVRLDIDFSEGHESATAWGCDLTKRYVDINTEYN